MNGGELEAVMERTYALLPSQGGLPLGTTKNRNVILALQINEPLPYSPLC